MPNPQGILKPGLTCDLRVRTRSASAVVLIPSKAVTEQMGEYFVFAVSGDKVTQRRITIGMTVDDHVVVQSGLQAGEQIVTEGMQRLRENAVVAPVAAGSAPAAPAAHTM